MGMTGSEMRTSALPEFLQLSPLEMLLEKETVIAAVFAHSVTVQPILHIFLFRKSKIVVSDQT